MEEHTAPAPRVGATKKAPVRYRLGSDMINENVFIRRLIAKSLA